jgi:hypothetical protein
MRETKKRMDQRMNHRKMLKEKNPIKKRKRKRKMSKPLRRTIHTLR